MFAFLLEACPNFPCEADTPGTVVVVGGLHGKSKTTVLGRFLGPFIYALLLCPTGTAAEPGIERIKKVNGNDATTRAMVYGSSTLSGISQVRNTGDEESTNWGKDLLSLLLSEQTERPSGKALPKATLTGFNREIQDEADDLATRTTSHFAAAEDAY